MGGFPCAHPGFNRKQAMMEKLKKELERYGAREFQVVAFSGDPERARSALEVARRKGAKDVLAYALSLYDDPEWRPATKVRYETNIAVEVKCALCSGDRFILAQLREPRQSAWIKEKKIIPSHERPEIKARDDYEDFLIEEMRPCPQCNAGAKI